MNKPYFSIVFPVYNVQRYLEKSVQSILKQSYQDFEIILVNDCSTDDSGNICEKLAKTNKQIRVIHKDKNEGLSEARNTGMQYVTGEYVLFLDSDDYVDENLLEKTKESLIHNPAKVVIFGLVEEYEDGEGKIGYTKRINHEQKLLNSKASVRNEVIRLEEKTLFGYAWNKAYQVSYLKDNGFCFEKVTMIEDIVFNINYFKEIDSCNILDITPYHYGIRNIGNLTSKFLPDYFELHEKRIQLMYDLYTQWNLCNETVKNILAKIYCRYLLSALQRNCDKRANMNFKSRKQWLINVYRSSMYPILVPHASSDNGILSFIYLIFKKKYTFIGLCLARATYIVKEKMPGLFSKIKQSR